MTGDLLFGDGVVAKFGTGQDLRIQSVGDQGYIQNYTGDLQIQNRAVDKDILFRADDGSGSVTTYLYLDGGGVLTRAVKNIRTNDGVKFQAGSSCYLEMFHDGSNSYIENYTGDFIFTQALDDGDMIFKSDNGSGGTTPYFSLDGGNTRTNIHKAFRFDDTIKCEFGNSGDLQIRHDGTNSEVVNLTGNLTFQNLADDKDIIFQSDNGSGGFATYFRVDGGAVETRFLKSTRHFDNVGAYFGDSADLQIFHNGSHSYIKDIGTGSLYLQTNGAAIYLQDTDGNAMAQFTDGGGNFLFYNANLKLSTTNTGVTVTGAVTATTFLGDLNGTINTATTAVTKANATNDTTVATTAFVQNLIGTIPAGLVFQGTWNASTNTPTLTSGSGTTGHFYIVSTDGSTNLDGITDWKVGDWAVFVEQGASDQWEKVDNSSVLDGSGTGQKVTKWDGSGTSNTLTDGPITFSGNDSTFAGSINLSSATGPIITLTDTDASIGVDSIIGHIAFVGTEIGSETSRIASVSETAGGEAGLRFYTGASVTQALQLDKDQNATFTGNVGIGTTSPGEKLEVDGIIKVVHTDNSYANYRGHGVFFNRTENYLAPLANNTSTLNIGYNGAKWGNIEINGAFIKFENGPNEFMRIDSSGRLLINATSTAFSDKFYVNSDAYATGGWRVGTAATYVGKLINDGGKLTLMSDGSRDVQIGNNNNPAMLYVDTSSANVGIGVTSPQSKLQVAGGIQMANDTATASAAKVGTMRYRTGTEYVEVTGTEILPNPGFDTDTNWVKGTGWTIANGKASVDNASSTALSQPSFGVTTGKIYNVRIDVSNYTSGSLQVQFGASQVIASISASGEYNYTVTSTITGGTFYLYGVSDCEFSVDNASVIEVEAENASYADMCMQTGSSTYEWVNIVRNTY